MNRDDVLDNMIEVKLNSNQDFLILKETLERIGVASKKDKTLYQTVHVLHKQGHYYLAHFKELMALDGKPTTLSDEDIKRRNKIAALLEDWELVQIKDPEKVVSQADLSKIKIISRKEKENWELAPKYNIGAKKKQTA